eukprot:jgi/Tetstr1/426719/TSEL_001656.t1
MKEMDKRMAMVALTSDFGRPILPMLPSTGPSGVVRASWSCEKWHFAETVAVLVLGDMFDNAEHQHLAFMWHMLQGAVIHYRRDCEECDAPADNFVGKWEAAVADDVVDMFEGGAEPGCSGAVKPGTSAAPDNDSAACVEVLDKRYGHRRACVAAGGRRTRDEGVIWKGDPGDFYMKVIAKKFRGVWHYGVITGVVTEWVLEDYGGATQWRAVFEDGSGKVTVQSGWVMEDCLHHMETFSILNAGPLLEEARVKAIMTEKELRVVRHSRGAKARRPGQRGAKARRPGQRGAKARRPGQRGAKARRPGQRGAKARRPGQRGAKARRPGQRGAKARRPGQRGAKARRPGQRGAKARRPGQRGAKARRPGQRGAKARRPGQRGAKARRPGQRGAKARRPGQRGAKARRPGQRGAKARRPGQRGAKARRPGQRGAKARRPGQRGAKARRPGQRGAKTAHTAESAERDALQAVDGSR